VQDYYTGHVLMLAYVNQESYDFMLAHGETCFWSRSRNELWHKGATSGNVQKIRSMTFDCDGDTLLIHVEQSGEGACHTGSFSCFGDEAGAFHSSLDGILEQIFEQIADRKANPQEKSYTNYLLDQGVCKICKKVGEEAVEAVIATMNEDIEGLIGEISDLTYHLLVLMFTQGVTPQDVQAELAKRHHVQGNLKEKNTKGDY